jgi:ribosomal protein S4E
MNKINSKIVGKKSKEFKDGARCRVVGGTHTGKSGIVKDVHTSKTGYVTITVVQDNDVRLKTLAKNVELI